MALDDQTAWDMTDEDTTQGGSNVLPGGIVSPQGSMDINGLLRQVMAQQPVQLPQMPTRSPSDGTSPGWLGLLGEALAGGQSPLYKLRGAQEDTAGSRALLNFGIGMMLGSGPSIVKPSLFSAAAQGLQAAQQSMDTSQQAAYAQAGQQFEQQKALAQLGIQQQDARIKQMATALQLLRLQGAAGLQSPFGAPGTAAPGGYAGSIAGIEGTGKNPASTAQGVGQFTDATWNEFVQANPSVFAGMTPQQIQAARADPAIGTNAINWLAQRNAGALKNLGAPATGQSLGIAHFLGAGAAAAVMNAPDGMPVSAFVSPEAVKANPQLASMTVGQLKQRYANVPAPAFLGGTQYAGPGVPTGSTPAPAAPAAPPGVQVGGAVPGPPGGTGGAATPYPASGAGIGRVLSGTQGVPGSQPVTVRPPPSPADIRVSPTLRGDVTGGVPIASTAPIAPTLGPALPPSPAVAGDVQAMLGGMQGARPTLAGGTATAGPGARAAPVGGFGVTAAGQPAIGDYGSPAAAAPPSTAPAVPPAATTPAPTTAPPATTPPPPADVPDEKLSLPAYFAKYKQPPTAEQVRNATVGGDTAFNKQLADQADAVQKAHAATQIAETAYNNAFHSAQTGMPIGDVNKAMTEYQNAQKAEAQANYQYDQLFQQADQATKTNLTGLDKAQTDQLTTSWGKIRDNATQIALKTQEGQQALELEKQRAANAIALEQAKGQTTAQVEVEKGLNESRSTAQTAIDQLQLARGLSRTAGEPGFWQTVQQTHPGLVTALANMGALSEDTVQQLGFAGATDAAFNRLITLARSGTGFTRPTNLDVSILRSQAPTSVDPEAWREAKLDYMQSYMERQRQYVDNVHSLMTKPGMTIYDAQIQADKITPPIVQTAPANPEGRAQWLADHVQPNTFVRLPGPEGKLFLYPGPQAAPPPAVSVPGR